jgi:hypothetical protein
MLDSINCNCPHTINLFKELKNLMIGEAYRHSHFQKIVDNSERCVNQQDILGEEITQDSRSDFQGGNETSDRERRLNVLTSDIVAEALKEIGEEVAFNEIDNGDGAMVESSIVL